MFSRRTVDQDWFEYRIEYGYFGLSLFPSLKNDYRGRVLISIGKRKARFNPVLRFTRWLIFVYTWHNFLKRETDPYSAMHQLSNLIQYRR